MHARLALYYRRLGTSGCRRWYDYLLLLLLLPLSYIYALSGSIRAWLYRANILSAHHAHVPVISVGNLVVGGTGKTPVVGLLLDFLHQRGYRVAVISRGYASSPTKASNITKVREVVVRGEGGRAMAAAQFGDEPVMLALRHPQVPVVIAPRRVDGVRYIQNQHQVDVIVLDDGFQHLALERNLDLVLLDAKRPFGNGHVLPAGLMREWRTALKRADMLLITRYTSNCPEFDPQDKPLGRIEYNLARYGVDLKGGTVDIHELKHLRVGAFAGVANPDDFFASLHRCGIHPVTTVSFADHVAYTSARVRHILECCAEVDALITTEKDAVKLEPALLSVPCYSIPLVLKSLDEHLLETVVLNVLGTPSGLGTLKHTSHNCKV